ncbi:MAG: molybdopterin-guanine dinucleotide biosynthesis protein B [Planctomycetota bacterium]
MSATPDILCIVGRKAVGKTTLIERLVPALARRGYRVGTVKRPPHPFEFDQPGKDSRRHFGAGAAATLLYGHGTMALVRRLEHERPVQELVERFLGHCDLVLVEGHKTSSLPKIEVFRSGVHPRPLYAGQAEYLAVASDAPLDVGLPRLDLGDPEAIAGFVAARFPRAHA